MSGVAFQACADSAEWADGAAAALGAGVSAGGALAIAGGKTPEAVCGRLAILPLPWDAITIYPTDERLAPEGHPSRNVDALRRWLAGAPARVEPLERVAVPLPDAVLLGMGTDGHIASLFPSAAGLAAALDPAAEPSVTRMTPDPLPPEAPFPRLTLNLAALARARVLVLAISGPEKRSVFEAEAAAPPRADRPIPALIGAAQAPLRVFWTP